MKVAHFKSKQRHIRMRMKVELRNYVKNSCVSNGSRENTTKLGL